MKAVTASMSGKQPLYVGGVVAIVSVLVGGGKLIQSVSTLYHYAGLGNYTETDPEA